MKNHLFSVLSGDERVMWSDEGADTRKRRKTVQFFLADHAGTARRCKITQHPSPSNHPMEARAC